MPLSQPPDERARGCGFDRRFVCRVGEQAEYGNQEMTDGFEIWMSLITHHADDAAQHVEQEGAEVRG